MGALDRKLIRDLAHVWSQALAISMVLASGIATLIMAQSAHLSLQETRTAYYERHRFADVFATARRAPEALEDRIAAIPGVMTAEGRVQGRAILDIEGVVEPASGLVLSMPPVSGPLLNTIYMREGRLPDSARADEVVVNEAFANAHGFAPGARFSAVLGGRRRTLSIVGVGLSPEFIYALGPGDLVPNDRRFAVIWMGEAAAQAAFDLEGAFNSVTLRLMRSANPDAVVDHLDDLLAPYGGRGAYLRKDQQSHAFIDAELKQLSAMSRIIPPIFLAVAAFLVNMTLARLIALEREQIGLLKALGYSNRRIAAHYLKFVLVVAIVGIVIGSGVGVWLGRGLTRIYGSLYHFPFLVLLTRPELFVIGGVVGVAAAWAGSWQAISRALALSPAVAMAPPAPLRYRKMRGEKLGRLGGGSLMTMMVFRHLARFPLRAGLTIIGVAASGALLVMSLSSLDAVEEMIQVTYFQSSRQDVTVAFDQLEPERAALAMARLPGVMRAEPFRRVDVTIRKGPVERRIALEAVRPDADLRQVLALDFRAVSPPEHGVAVSDMLAKLLDLRVGDRVTLETMDQHRRVLELPVTMIEQGYLGLTAHARLDVVTALLGDGRAISGVDLAVDPNQREAFFSQVKDLPTANAVMMLKDSLKTFRATLAENLVIMMTVYVALSVVITFGVVYNSARVQLSERARELASLRVLGFTRGEVSAVLLGEIALTVACALPLGFGLGYLFTGLLLASFETELYRVPLIINRSTYGWSAVILIATEVVSALIVRRRVDRLDMIAVLKTRE